MDELTQSQDEQKRPAESRVIIGGKPAHKHWAAWLLAVLLLASLGGNAYLWMQSQKATNDLNAQRNTNQQLQSQIDALRNDQEAAGTADDGEDSSACTYRVTDSLKENIKAALDSKNTAAFSTYTSNPVKYVLAASEQGGNVTPDQAAQNLEYTHSASGPWDVNLPDTTIDEYDRGEYTQYFDGTTTLVTKSSDGMVVSFEFNCGGDKITEIFVAQNEELVLPVD